MSQQSRTNRPLELVGIDCQPTGKYSKDSMLVELSAYMEIIKPDFLHTAKWDTFHKGVMMLYSRNENGFATIGIDSFAEACKAVRSVIEESRPTKKEHGSKRSFWIQTVRNVEIFSAMAFTQSFKVWQKRDEQMAENIVWLTKAYPGKKIIAWAATDHIIKNQMLINGESYNINSTTRMGDVLYERLGCTMYSIGFTAYGGSALNIGTNTAYSLPPPSRTSIEEILSGTPGEVLFVDYLNGNTALRRTLGEKFISRPLGNAEMAGNWMQCLDGMIFIRNTKPSILEK